MNPNPLHTPDPVPGLPRWLKRAMAGLAVAGVLTAVGLSYLSTGMVVDLANRFWSCF
ncbi:hypothetical protein [Sphaerotilus mobilis]|uniref:Uncharacterized protein n=1 Tax=Sphaerotilus mobilis TaxID=47994 RepID=A0A4Q7LUW0_9BURK|nr:hypothetical protein [Sphaerotilus mobilis]RZS58037.1 hypothetical protein EV685_0314 [Sphaerotilus mobilis]